MLLNGVKKDRRVSFPHRIHGAWGRHETKHTERGDHYERGRAEHRGSPQQVCMAPCRGELGRKQVARESFFEEAVFVLGLEE